jgi:hypothetical protein
VRGFTQSHHLQAVPRDSLCGYHRGCLFFTGNI